VGRDVAAKVWYRTLSTKLTSGSTYTEAREGAITSAREIYGDNSTACKIIQAAFDGITVPAGAANCNGGVNPPVELKPATSGPTVVVSWQDRSSNEDGFAIRRTDGTAVADLRTRDKGGMGGYYTVVDSAPDTGGIQCYVVVGYDDRAFLSDGISKTACVGGGLAAPLLSTPEPSVVGSVALRFTDRSTNEDGFSIWRVNSSDTLVSPVDDLRTTDGPGIGSTSTLVDAHPLQGGSACYVVIGYDDEGSTSGGLSDSLCSGAAALLSKPIASADRTTLQFTDRSGGS